MKKLLFIPAAMIAATLSLAAGADAHTPSVQPSCSGLAESFSLYEGNATNNRVTTTIDGVVSVADFGGSYSHTFAWSQTVAHVWSVVVDADRNSGNATQYDTQFSGTWQPCQTPTTTVVTTTTTVPPTTTSTTVPVTTTTVALSPSGSVGVTCESLILVFSGYGGDATNNRITMQIDGATPWYITFGDHYQASFANTDQTRPHTWTVFVDANRNTGDPTLYDHTYTGTQDACTTATTVTTVAASLCTYDLALPADSPLCLPPATGATVAVVVPGNAIATSDRLLPLTGPRPSNTGIEFAAAFALLCGLAALRVTRRP